MLKVPNDIVTPNWLYENIDTSNLIVLDATIPKVTSDFFSINSEKKRIKGARFFDVKNEFSDEISTFPNTILSSKEFEEKAQKLGVFKDSCVVVYDDLGVYSSSRVWWNFKLMGFSNIAVLDGGLPAWNKIKYPVEKPQKRQVLKGDFETVYQPQRIAFTEEVLEATKTQAKLILDARSSDRFYGITVEPRKGIRSGHIPTSKNLPYTSFLEGSCFKSKEEILSVLEKENPQKKAMIFSCGSGITASILALGAEIAGYDNVAVYDGSWTEWGSGVLPIENNKK